MTPSEDDETWLLEPSQQDQFSDSRLVDNPVPPKLGLLSLKERVCRLLYSSRGIRCTNGELLLNIRQLDAQLESWRVSLPRNIRPSLSIPRGYRPITHDTSDEQDMLRVNLQLEYHYLMIVIHATVRRCRAGNNESGGMPEDLHSVLHSSTDLSLEASRSTLVIMEKYIEAMVVEGFQ